MENPGHRRESHTDKSRRPGRRREALLAALAGALILALPAPASAVAETAPEQFAANGMDEHVIAGPVPESKVASRSSSAQVANDSQVTLQVDPEYAGGPAVQRVLSTLASLSHGAEMSKLTVHIAGHANLTSLCGQGATACYYLSAQKMVISGEEENTNNAMPQEMVIAHEYGHHLEANRSSAGWASSKLGTPHWANYEQICAGVQSGQLFPGDQGSHYWENPGEAFAQAYAFMHFPNEVPWWWSFAEPDPGAYQAVLADVNDPAPGPRKKWAGRLSAGKSRALTTISAELPGRIKATLRQRGGAKFELRVLRPGGSRVLRRARSRQGSRASVSYDFCQPGSVRFEVRRVSGKGRFTVKIRRV